MKYQRGPFVEFAYGHGDTHKQREKQEDIWIPHTELASAPGHPLQEATNTLKGILNIIHIQLNPAQKTMILRGTPDQMVLAEKLLEDIDKAEVGG